MNGFVDGKPSIVRIRSKVIRGVGLIRRAGAGRAVSMMPVSVVAVVSVAAAGAGARARAVAGAGGRAAGLFGAVADDFAGR